MNRDLLNISIVVPKGRHVLVVLGDAGWHRSKGLGCPEGVSILRQLPFRPELNPADSELRFLEERYITNVVSETAEAATETVAMICERFAASLGQVRSIGHRSRARLTPGAVPAIPGRAHV